MADIIDINVYETTETVAITVTPNLTTININSGIGVVPSLQDVTDVGSITTNSITANGFIKTGGTNSQFLMADGSISTGGGSGSVANIVYEILGTISNLQTLINSSSENAIIYLRPNTIYVQNKSIVLKNGNVIYGNGATIKRDTQSTATTTNSLNIILVVCPVFLNIITDVFVVVFSKASCGIDIT